MTHRWHTVIGLGLSLALLYWALHDVSFAELWEHIRSANLWLPVGLAALSVLAVGALIITRRLRS